MAIEVASVVGAAKHEQRVTEAPSSVTVVTAADIRTFGWRTLADVLRSVRGFYTTYDRNYTYLGVRGFGRPTDYNNRVLRDARWPPAQRQHLRRRAPIGTEGVVDLDLVERIESDSWALGRRFMAHRPSSPSINIITRRGGGIGGIEVEHRGRAWQPAISGRATAGWAWGDKGDLLVSASRSGSRRCRPSLYFPEFDTPETGDGRALDMDGDDATWLLVNARAGRVQACRGRSPRAPRPCPRRPGRTQFRRSALPHDGYRVAWLDATYERTVGSTTVADPRVRRSNGLRRRPIPSNRTTVNMDTERRTRGSAARCPPPDASVDGIGSPRASNSASTCGKSRTTGMSRPGDLHPRRSQLAAGGRVRSGRDHVEPPVDGHARRALGLVERRPRLAASAGGPGLSHRPRPGRQVSVRRGVPRRQRLRAVLHGQRGSTGNPDLRPERLTTSEVVFEQYLSGRVRLTASAFVTRIDDLIDQTACSSRSNSRRMWQDRAGRPARTAREDHPRQPRDRPARRGRRRQRPNTGRPAACWPAAASSRNARPIAPTGSRSSNAPEHLATLQLAAPLATRDLTLALDSTFVGPATDANGTVA